MQAPKAKAIERANVFFNRLQKIVSCLMLRNHESLWLWRRPHAGAGITARNNIAVRSGRVYFQSQRPLQHHFQRGTRLHAYFLTTAQKYFYQADACSSGAANACALEGAGAERSNACAG